MKRQIPPAGEFASPPLAAQSFCCCCPIVIPLLPFFALRWAVLHAAGKLRR